MKENIFWDLDGTLTDPKIGIVRSFQYALEAFNYPIPPENELLWIIGPPLQVSFAQIQLEADEFQVRQLIAKYRERFSTIGLFENSVYPGIHKMLMSLSSQNRYLATSKPEVFAKQILEKFELSMYFTRYYGSELDGRRSEKAELIRYILAIEELNPSEVVMIGDRKHDILGAKAAGVCSVAVTWGYGSHEELLASNPDFVFHNIQELQQFLSS